MSQHVAVEISGDGGDGGVRIVGGESALVPRAGIRVHGDPSEGALPAVVLENFEDDTYAFSMNNISGWFRDNIRAHSGSWSFRSPTIGHGLAAVVRVSVPAGATSMSFWWFADMEEGFDELLMFFDGVQQSFQGTGHSTEWTQETFGVTGVSEVEFRYVKDTSVSEGVDAVWIDDLSFQWPPGVGPAVVNGRVYGPLKAEMGELSDGDYGIAVVNDSGRLTKLTDFIFGPQAAYDQGEGTRTFATHAATYGDLVGASVGPSVDVMIGETGRCLIIVGAEITWDDGTTGDFRYSDTYGGRMSVALSGANNVSASDAWSYYFSQAWAFEFNTAVRLEQRGAANGSRMHFLTGLNPGLTTFTAKYRCVYNNQIQPARFKDRTLIVFPY